jgi:hypothetical protein
MKPTRPGLALLTGIAALATLAAGTGGAGAIAATSPDDLAPPGEPWGLEEGTNAGEDASADAVSGATPDPPSMTSVSLSGGLACSIPSIGEASTRWRYGRTRSDASIDETTSRVSVSGSGSGCDGLKVDFSVELLVPALRLGSYSLSDAARSPSGDAPPLWADLWARRDRASANPDLEWDTRLSRPSRPTAPARTPDAPGAPATLAMTITSVTEISHTSERLRGGTFTLDTTRFRVHGSIAGTLPCTRAVAPHRSTCAAETLVGTF